MVRSVALIVVVVGLFGATWLLLELLDAPLLARLATGMFCGVAARRVVDE